MRMIQGSAKGLSPRARGRIAGLFEALEGFTSATGQVTILGKLVVAGNAAATAANILAREPLFLLGFTLSVLGAVFHVVWIALFYKLFRPVNKTVSLVALCVGLVCCAIQALAALLYLGPWVVLHGGSAVSGFSAEQLHSLAYVFFRLNGQAFNLDLVFFGLWCVLTGYLVFRSSFLPRILGVLLVIDGIGWMLYLSPTLGPHLFMAEAIASALAEIPLQLWLLIMGVNSRRWTEQAVAAGELAA